jgi:hypothetical protein
MVYAPFNLVADRSGIVHAEAGGVGEDPFFVAASGQDGAGVAAPHGDYDVDGLEHVRCPPFGLFRRDVNAFLGHDGDVNIGS